jgi:hypothetical protein
MEEIEKEFWTLDSENVPFRKGWIYRAVELQQFMKKIQEDPRGGKILGINFDGKNVEFYTEASIQQMQETIEG